MTQSIENYEELANILNERMVNRKGGQNLRLARLMGMYSKDAKAPIKANIPEGDRSVYSHEKYKFLLDAPFSVSQKCCDVMKKSPTHEYNHKTGRHPMTAQMASESRLRTQKWVQNGCNGFHLKEPISNPMAFWTEQDVLLYLKLNNIPICSVYGDIVTEDEKDGQLNLNDIAGFELFDLGQPGLCTTGCNRTGCMFCGYGCHLEKPGEGRFERMKQTHPKQYDYIMRPKEEGGLNYKEIIDWINEHGGMNIRY